MLGISSQARFTENVGANFVACSVACLELFISFYFIVLWRSDWTLAPWFETPFFYMFLWISQWQGLLENKQEQG